MLSHGKMGGAERQQEQSEGSAGSAETKSRRASQGQVWHDDGARQACYPERQQAKSYGVSETFCWNLQRSAKRQKVTEFLAKTGTGNSARPSGSHLALVHLVSKALGRRLPDSEKTLGRPDFLKPVWAETRAWAPSHCSQAGRGDRETADSHAAEARHPLAGNAKQREKYKMKLLAKCGRKRRSCQQTTNLSVEEEKARLETACRGSGTSSSSRQPAPMARQRHETVITMSDQIPAWPKPSPGKVLTSVLRLKLVREQGKLRTAARAARKAASTQACADAAVEGALLGKQARVVVGDLAADSLRGQEVVCGKTYNHVLVECNDTQHSVEQTDITVDVGDRLLGPVIDLDKDQIILKKVSPTLLNEPLPANGSFPWGGGSYGVDKGADPPMHPRVRELDEEKPGRNRSMPKQVSEEGCVARMTQKE